MLSEHPQPPQQTGENKKGFMAGSEGSCWSEVRPRPLNLVTSQTSSPFIRRFDQFSPTELHPRRHKRKKVFSDGKDPITIPWVNNGLHVESMYKRHKSLPDVIDYSDPFSVSNMKEELDRGMYGSATKDIEDLCARRFKLLHPLLAFYPSLSSRHQDYSAQSPLCGLSTHDALNEHSKDVRQMMDKQISHLASKEIIDLDDDCKSYVDKMQGYESLCYMEMPKIDNGLQNHNDNQIVVLDSDDEESAEQILNTQASRYSPYASNFEVAQASQLQDPYNLGLDQGKSIVPYSSTAFLELHGPQNGKNRHLKILPDPNTLRGSNQKIHNHGNVLKKSVDEKPINDFAGNAGQESKGVKEPETPNAEKESKKDKGIYVGVQDNGVSINSVSQCDSDDGLGDIWRDMTVALECNKDAPGDINEYSEDEEAAECDHSFLLKDDLGYVCRVCGVIKKSIETIFDYQWGKGSKSTRTYVSESRSTKEKDENYTAPSEVGASHQLEVVDISVHPRHMKQMKPHQIEGFNFLVKNLISDDPGGCILAHAPGSGKTFMIISFIQSFLAKYPNARPLVVLPKGILGTWKREFIRWQVEDIPLYDFYSSKAEGRKEQLDILKEWVEHKGILFLGYKQFANIVSKSESNAAAACQDILLKIPTILICDEGHTPRNQDTDVLHSLEKVLTPRKVVLSGTLFQNHVKEVFNILNLVRPKFLKSDASKVIKRRVMSRGRIGRKQVKAGVDAAFFDVVEQTLQHDENSKVKIAVIQDLREMTKDVLHYYKGDFLDELPGIVDLTVLLNLSPKQKLIVETLKKLEKFKRASIGTAVYVHPHLKEFSDKATMADKGCNFNEDRMNYLINNMDIRDGAKAKFFLNIMRLCESSGEKLLVFSQYLLPLKFLERLLVNTKGWSPGKEIFMINGDTSSEDREWSMERFNNSSDAKVFFGSIKACGEGISLVGASRILIMDVHLNPSVTRQAVGRAFRPGQVRKVYVYRLVASDSPEEESHNTSFRKELISKMWFEWSEYCSNSNFEMESVSLKDSDDEFWESPSLREDVNSVKKR